MGVTFKQSGTAVVITLKGELTLPNAEELRSALINALIDSDDISIAVESVREVDLSCLQMLCSVHRSGVRMKKRVAFTGTLPKIFRNTIEAAGFSRLSGCKLDTEKTCLWAAAAGVKHG